MGGRSEFVFAARVPASGPFLHSLTLARGLVPLAFGRSLVHAATDVVGSVRVKLEMAWGTSVPLNLVWLERVFLFQIRDRRCC